MASGVAFPYFLCFSLPSLCSLCVQVSIMLSLCAFLFSTMVSFLWSLLPSPWLCFLFHVVLILFSLPLVMVFLSCFSFLRRIGWSLFLSHVSFPSLHRLVVGRFFLQCVYDSPFSCSPFLRRIGWSSFLYFSFRGISLSSFQCVYDSLFSCFPFLHRIGWLSSWLSFLSMRLRFSFLSSSQKIQKKGMSSG